MICKQGQGPKDIILLLHRYGADLSAKNKVGDTPMHKAAYGNNPFALSFLQHHKVDVDS